MKKMTAKEFKEALNKANFNTDDYCYENILNMLMGRLYTEALDMEERGLNLAAEYTRSRAAILFDILDARGYYND